jgi:hypothetical protein
VFPTWTVQPRDAVSRPASRTTTVPRVMCAWRINTDASGSARTTGSVAAASVIRTPMIVAHPSIPGAEVLLPGAAVTVTAARIFAYSMRVEPSEGVAS